MNRSEVVLVTGASSGIGQELARLFAADGAELILVARTAEKLNSLADELRANHNTSVTVIPLDLSHAGAATELYRQVTQSGKVVDILVNNAGFGQYGRFLDCDIERYTQMCQLNMVTLTELTHLFLKPMVERNSGAVLNVGSTASFQPGPHSAVYYATKAYVLSFSEAVHAELWGTNVTVTCLCPGPTKTGFGEDSEMDELLFFRTMAMDVRKVARAGFRGVRRRKRLVMPGLMNNLLAFSNRLTVRPVVLWFVKRIQPVKE